VLSIPAPPGMNESFSKENELRIIVVVVGRYP